jgi:Cell division septal protein
MAKQKNRNGGHRRGAAIYTPVAALLVLFIIIFGVSVFFRVTKIEVTGSARYTDDEIIAASGVELGDNLFLLNSDAAARRITDAMPYISAVRIGLGIPDTAVLEVTESVAFAAVQTGNDYWKVDSSGRILERTDYSGASGLIRVTGLTLVAPKEGTKIAVDSAYETQLGYALDVFAAIDGAEIGNDVSSLDMTNISAITLVYKTTVTVKFGGGDNADFKITKLLVALDDPDVPSDFKGTIDVSKDEKTNVIPG